MYIVQIHSPTQHQYSLPSISLTQSDSISIEKITNPPHSKNAATTEIHQMQWSTAAHHMEASACKPLLQTWHIPTQSIALITMQHQPPTKPGTHHYLMGTMLSRDRKLHTRRCHNLTSTPLPNAMDPQHQEIPCLYSRVIVLEQTLVTPVPFWMSPYNTQGMPQP